MTVTVIIIAAVVTAEAFSNAYYVPNTILSTSHILTNLILTTNLRGSYNHIFNL